MAVKPIPDGYTSVTAYLYVSKSAEAIEFYQKAFGAKEVMRLTSPDGGIAHAEIEIGNAKLMLADENPQWGNLGPIARGGPTCGFALYVPDVDAAFAHAVACGATVVMPVMDMFYGDRTGSVTDPFGHKWTLATHVKDMDTAEMQVGMDEMMKAMAAQVA